MIDYQRISRLTSVCFRLEGMVHRMINTRVARFFLVQYTKTGKNIPNNHKISQMATKYTKWTEHLPNGPEIYQHLPLSDPPKFAQIGIFGLKTNHLATLINTLATPGKSGVSKLNSECKCLQTVKSTA
jgi:hypothetical protein